MFYFQRLNFYVLLGTNDSPFNIFGIFIVFFSFIAIPSCNEKQIKHDKYCFLVPFFVLRMKMQKKRIPNKQYNLPSSNKMAHFLLWMLINKTTTLHNSAKIMFIWFYSIVPEAMQIIYLCYYIALKQSMSEEFLQHYLP